MSNNLMARLTRLEAAEAGGRFVVVEVAAGRENEAREALAGSQRSGDLVVLLRRFGGPLPGEDGDGAG